MFLFVMHRFFLAPLVLDVCFPAFQWIVVDVFTSCQFDLGIMSSACFLPCSGRTSSSAPGQRKGSAGEASVNLSKRLSNRQMAKHDACVYFHFSSQHSSHASSICSLPFVLEFLFVASPRFCQAASAISASTAVVWLSNDTVGSGEVTSATGVLGRNRRVSNKLSH